MAGHVWDGSGLTQQDYSSVNFTVSARWRGFSDDQSYVDHYLWCVGTQPEKQDIVTCRDVGLHTRSTTPLSTAQSAGTNKMLFTMIYNAMWYFVATYVHVYMCEHIDICYPLFARNIHTTIHTCPQVKLYSDIILFC